MLWKESFLACLGCYAHTNHRGQRATSPFPEALLLFLFLCGGITVKKKGKMGNNTILGVPVRPSFRNPSLRHSGRTPKDLLQKSLLISSSNTWVWDAHFCTTYRTRGFRTTGQMLEALWLCVRSQKMMCRNLTTIISSLSDYTEICRYRMSVNLLLLLKILEAAVFFPPTTVMYIQHLELIILFFCSFRIRVSYIVRSVYTTLLVHYLDI